MLAGHVHLTYDSAHSSAIAEVLATHRDNATLTYAFNGITQSSNTKKFVDVDASPVSVSIYGADGSRVDLDPIDFIWNNPPVHPIQESQGDYRNGQKGSIVELFMWPHTEVQQECNMLAKMGYMGVKLYPAQVSKT